VVLSGSPVGHAYQLKQLEVHRFSMPAIVAHQEGVGRGVSYVGDQPLPESQLIGCSAACS